MRCFSLVLYLISFASYAEVVENWKCTEYTSGRDVLVVASVNKGRETGEITVAGIKYKTKFSVKGFNRRWDFVLSEDYSYDYALVIEPNGDAYYVDFSDKKFGETGNPSQLLKCKQ